MSNLLEKSSLVLTPTAYDNGKLLSVKPTDGIGDFDFTRNSSATRVNELGLVEDVQILSSNLVQNGDFSQEGSEQITNGDFSNGSTDWSNPDNAATFSNDSVTISGGSGNRRIIQANVTSPTSSQWKLQYEIIEKVGTSDLRTYTTSGYSVIPSTVGIHTYYFNSNLTNFYFNFSDSTGSITIDNVSVKEVGQDWTLGTGWSIGNDVANAVDAAFNSQLVYSDNVVANTKYKVSFNVSNYVKGNVRVNIGNVGSDTVSSNGNFTFVLTSANVAPLIIQSWAGGSGTTLSITNISVIEITEDTNLPRIDYTDGVGSWLFEPQSTNLITYSEDFSQSYWRKDKITVTDNSIISPSGQLDASLIQETVYTSGIPSLDLSNSITLSGTYTYTFYVKNNNGRYLGISFGSNAERIRTNFDFNTNTFKTLIFNGTTTGLASFTNLGDYYRISITATFTSSTVADIVLMPLATDTYPFFDFQNSDNRSFYLWGAQLEQSSFATSYIPTNGSTVTRLADAASGAGSSDLINSTEGVLYFEGSALTNETDVNKTIGISNVSSSNRVQLTLHGTPSRISFYGTSSEGFALSYSNFSYNKTEPLKIAVKWKIGDVGIFINGIKVYTGTPANTFLSNTLNTLSFADYNNVGSPFYGKTKCLAVFKEALTDEELECLTTI